MTSGAHPPATRRRSIAVLGAIALAALLPLACSSTSAREAQLPALHARRGVDPGIFDSSGRQVLLRGVDLNVLGDYFQADPHEAPVVPYSPKMFDLMAAQGFDVVRLVLSWSALEPERGVVDQKEVRRIHQVVDDAAARGIYVVLDMHQDAWGKYIATPPGVTCPAGTQHAIGWDGAPRWATLTDGASTCRVPGVRELSPAVIKAFENFYADRDGIEDQFVMVWSDLAASFAADTAVAGYDLFNEPHFGSGPAATNRALASLYGRLVGHIRAAERSVPHGFSHIVFFEPDILWSGLGQTSVPSPTFTADTNIVFSPHLYGGSLAPISVQAGYEAAQRAAESYGTTLWAGEWGGFSDPRRLKTTIAEFARLQDETLTGGAWWQWSQACGDPHSLNTSKGPSSIGSVPAKVMSFNWYTCPGSHYAGPVAQWAEILSRSYPRFAPGRLESLVSDPATGRMTVSGTGSGSLELWVPDRGHGTPRVTGPVSSGHSAELEAVSGGWLVTVTVSGAYRVSVTFG